MYRNLGIHWASAVPGFLALACLPFPFLFYKYGATIRAKCKYTQQAEALMQEMMAGQGESKAGASPEEQAKRDRQKEQAEAIADDYPAEEEGYRSPPSEHTLAEEGIGQPKRKPTP